MKTVKKRKTSNSSRNRKKTKKGFTLIEIIAAIIIIGILAIVTVPAVSKYVNNSKDTTYSSYEKNMEIAAGNQVINCLSENDKSCRIPDKGEKVLVYLNELVDNGYLEELKDPEAEGYCDSAKSYVEVENTGSADYEYNVCLYCKNYVTDDVDCSEYESD